MDNWVTWFTVGIGFVPVILVFAIMPWITRKDVVFGITVPIDNWNDDIFKQLRLLYVKLVIAIGILAFAGAMAAQIYLSELTAMYVLEGLLFGLLFIYFIVYIGIWKRVKAYKKQMQWDEIGNDVVIAETEVTSRKSSISPLWFVLYILVIAATILVGMLLYENAPDTLAMQYDMDGNVTRYAEKSMNIVYQMVGIQVLLFAMFVGIYYVIQRAKRNIDPTNPQKSAIQNGKMRFWWSAFLMITGLLLVVLFMLIVFSIFGAIHYSIMTAASLVLTGIILVGAIVIAVKVGQSGSKLNAGSSTTDSRTGRINRKDDKYWKYGSIYFNKDDPSVFIEKRFGVGWTMNFAKWQSWLAIAAILAMVVLSLVFAV